MTIGIGIGLGMPFAPGKGVGALPVGRFRVPMPDIPTSAPGRGFANTGLYFRDGTSFVYAADGTGRETQSVGGANNCSLVQMLWNANANSLAYVASWLLSALMAGLFEDGSSPTWGAGSNPVDASTYSIQGISYRVSDDTIHITCQRPTPNAATWKLIIHPDTGARVGQARIMQDINHLEVDNVRSRVMALTGTTMQWRNITSLSSTGLGTAYTHGLSGNVDHLDIDETRDLIHVSVGANNVEGTIATLRLNNDASLMTQLGTYTDTDALAIEGIRSQPDALYIMSDEYYHECGPANVMIVIRPNPLLALYPG